MFKDGALGQGFHGNILKDVLGRLGVAEHDPNGGREPGTGGEQSADDVFLGEGHGTYRNAGCTGILTRLYARRTNSPRSQLPTLGGLAPLAQKFT